MYAIIRTGGKQQKVQEGDVLDVERLKGTETARFTPVLLVTDDGSVVTGKDALAKASVTVEIVGEHRGNKIEAFTYKNKTGNRKRQGHRQTYTTIKVTKIDAGAEKKAAKKKDEAPAEPKAKKEPKAKAETKPKPKAAAAKAETKAEPEVAAKPKTEAKPEKDTKPAPEASAAEEA